MSERQPPPDMDVEPTFDSFVEWFGGELVRKALPSNTNVPLNADYFLRSRTIVAELKCLENGLHGQARNRKESRGADLRVGQARLIAPGALRRESHQHQCTWRRLCDGNFQAVFSQYKPL